MSTVSFQSIASKTNNIFFVASTDMPMWIASSSPKDIAFNSFVKKIRITITFTNPATNPEVGEVVFARTESSGATLDKPTGVKKNFDITTKILIKHLKWRKYLA